MVDLTLGMDLVKTYTFKRTANGNTLGLTHGSITIEAPDIISAKEIARTRCGTLYNLDLNSVVVKINYKQKWMMD